VTPRVLLAWEGGAGRGHISTMRTVARALDGVAICDAAVNSMRHAAELAPHCELVFPGSAFAIDKRRRSRGGNEPICSWADHLGDLGFGDAAFLVARIGWWIAAIRARVASVVVADFAPVATLAARVLGLRTAVIGTGYLAPPPGLAAFPILVPALSVAHYDEADLLAAVNTALAHYGAAPLARFSDIYQCDAFFPHTIPALDPYAGHRAAPYLQPVATDMPTAGNGDEIFGYFSTDEPRDDVLLEALRRLGPLLRLHMPGLKPEQAAVLAAAGVKVERAPLPLHEIAARSRFCLNAGQHGTLCMAMAMGLPQFAIPRHLEHAYHADKARQLGCVAVVSRFERDPDIIVARIMASYEDAGQRRRARAVAGEHRAELCGPLQPQLRQRLMPLLS
jgi:UDP:flavonoid glycosyltransferase YjiC (YdhE family)